MITSSANSTIKQVRKLRERKERSASGLFYIEGLRIVIEAARQNAPIQTLLYSPELLTSEGGLQEIHELQRRGIETLEVSAGVFRSLALKDDPQGIAAVVAQTWQPIESISAKEGDLWVALEEVADPGNLGTILRTCDGAGACGVILLDHSTDPYDPIAMRASMGAIFTQKLVKSNLDQFTLWVRNRNIPIIGTSGAARDDYHAFKYPDPFVLLMGSERQGLSEKALALCGTVVRIPMVGRNDSLNLAVATAVMLYEVYNYRRDSRREGQK